MSRADRHRPRALGRVLLNVQIGGPLSKPNRDTFALLRAAFKELKNIFGLRARLDPPVNIAQAPNPGGNALVETTLSTSMDRFELRLDRIERRRIVRPV